jgi:ubiquinone/menaquinone biosynthesis C-methylase UbiE
MPILDHFGIIAPLYDQVIQLRRPEKLISLLNLPIHGSLLDAGGGTGRVTQYLREIAYPLVITDISLGMLHQAGLKDGLQRVCSLAENLPFPDETFERVIMIDALHHVYNQRYTVSELWRVLKHGGRIVIEEPDIRNIAVKLVAIAEKLALMRSHFMPPMRISALFTFSNACIHVEREGYNAWVIVDKYNY